MAWQLIVAIVLVVPIILFPAALVWYMNVSGLFKVMREARQRQQRRVALSKVAGQ